MSFVSSDSEKQYYTRDGKVPDKIFDKFSDISKTKDGYVRLRTNFPQYVPSSILPVHLPRRTAPKQGPLDILLFEPHQSRRSDHTQPRGPREDSKRLCSSDTSALVRGDGHDAARDILNPISITKDRRGALQ